MQDYIESDNYNLSESEKSYIINDINYLLNSLPKILKTQTNQNKIFTSSMICEYMLNLELKNKGYLVKTNTPISDVIDFCKSNRIIPNECVGFLETIPIFRNKDLKPTDKLTDEFIDTFLYFIIWFNGRYDNAFEIDLSVILKSDKKLYSVGELEFQNIPFDSNASDWKMNQLLILQELNQHTTSLDKILKTVLKTLEITENIDRKIDIITNNLSRIQRYSEKLIESAISEDEIDRIIETHTAECVENIIESENDFSKDSQFKQEEIKLIDNFSQDTWNKLSNESEKLLITSKFMYNKLIVLDEVIDYSGICILVTKALEIEIFKRFFTNFLKYLKEKYGNDYSQYHSTLLFNGKTPLYPQRFTMGSIAYVLCYREDGYCSSKQRQTNERRLLEYCQEHIFSEYPPSEIKRLLNEYASKIEEIRVKYRNPSAHRNRIQRKDAKECMDLIIDVEKLLKKMLDSFDM